MSDDPMSSEDPMSRSGARWCDRHKRWECNANKPNHHASAIRGQAKCRHCVGKKTAVAKSEGEAKMAAWSLAAASNMAGTADMPSLMLSLIYVTATRLDVIAEELRKAYAAGGVDALVGSTYAVGRDGQRIQTGEQVRGLVKLEGDERDKLARYVKAAHDMGIDERRTQLAEGAGEQLAAVLRAVFGRLDLSEGQWALVAVVVPEELRKLAALGTGPPPALSPPDVDRTEFHPPQERTVTT